jgi:predicted HicB family RNase H-like nuclease
METMKKPLPVRVEEATISKLKLEAEEQNRSLSNHVDTVLTQHVNKKPQAHTPKQEYKP